MNNQLYHFEITHNFELDDSVEEALNSAEYFKTSLLELGVDKFIFQLERGKISNRLHFQGYFHIKVRNRETTLNKLWKSIIEGTLKKGSRIKKSSTAGINNLKNYCMKTDTRIGGPWADKKLYLGEDLPSELLPWQQDLKNYILGEVNPREIIWVYDKCGCGGKSIFSKYMCYYHDCLLLSYGKTGDLLNLVSKNQNKKCYLFDLTRVKPDSFSNDDLYSSIEEIKKGHFINLKYETEQILMSKPHIIVFSNHLPQMKSLSIDMWNILELPKNSNPHKPKTKKFKSSAFKTIQNQ